MPFPNREPSDTVGKTTGVHVAVAAVLPSTSSSSFSPGGAAGAVAPAVVSAAEVPVSTLSPAALPMQMSLLNDLVHSGGSHGIPGSVPNRADATTAIESVMSVASGTPTNTSVAGLPSKSLKRKETGVDGRSGSELAHHVDTAVEDNAQVSFAAATTAASVDKNGSPATIKLAKPIPQRSKSGWKVQPSPSVQILGPILPHHYLFSHFPLRASSDRIVSHPWLETALA
jgi:hypothetical protein